MSGNLHRQKLRRILRKQWRKFKRNVLFPVEILVFVVILTLLAPLLVPIAFLLHEREQKRMYALAETFRCAGCNVILGKAAILRAEAEWGQYVNELHRQNPGYRFRLVYTVHAICTECGKPYQFCEKGNSFLETQMPEITPSEI